MVDWLRGFDTGFERANVYARKHRKASKPVITYIIGVVVVLSRLTCDARIAIQNLTGCWLYWLRTSKTPREHGRDSEQPVKGSFFATGFARCFSACIYRVQRATFTANATSHPAVRYQHDMLDEEVKLNPRQEQFVAEYLIDLNATKAYIRAGYAADDANVGGPRLLAHVGVAQRVAVGLAQREARTKVTQDSVLHEMSLLANSRLDWFAIDDHGQVTLTDIAPEGAMGAVASIKRKTRVVHGKGGDPGYTEYDVEIKLWDKPAPLKLMGRHVGLFPDKVEHSGPGGGPIETVTKIEQVIVDPKGS